MDTVTNARKEFAYSGAQLWSYSEFEKANPDFRNYLQVSQDLPDSSGTRRRMTMETWLRERYPEYPKGQILDLKATPEGSGQAVWIQLEESPVQNEAVQPLHSYKGDSRMVVIQDNTDDLKFASSVIRPHTKLLFLDTSGGVSALENGAQAAAAIPMVGKPAPLVAPMAFLSVNPISRRIIVFIPAGFNVTQVDQKNMIGSNI